MTTSIGPNPEVADLVLIRRVTGGDESALAILYDRYASLVYSVAKRVLDDSSAAEEVVQDIFYLFWRTASNFDSARGSLAGWLLVTTRNRSIDRLRRRHGVGEEEIQEDIAGLSINLETAAAQNELMSKVKISLGELPASQRSALELAYFEGLTHSEIAQRTGEPLGTIKTRLRAAIESLKKRLHP